MMTTEKDVYKILENVADPEVPVLTVLDLGIIRKVIVDGDDVEVVITPTYSGCPAMNTFEWNIREELMANGFQKIKITTVLSPAWTTDWLSEEGKRKLKEYGIAPPVGQVDKGALFIEEKTIPCPRCESENTKMISQFGSTACKALYQCNDCLEPFDYFKCH